LTDEPMLIDPTHKIAVAFDDHDHADAAEAFLIDAGWPMADIQVLVGQEGVERIDASGKRHGIFGRAVRVLQQLGDELNFFSTYSEELKTGAVVLLIPIHGDEQKHQAHQILTNGGGHKIVHFGNVTMEELP